MRNPVSLAAALELLVSHRYSVEMLPNDKALIVKRAGVIIPNFFWIENDFGGNLVVDGDAVCQACHAHLYHPKLPPQRL